MLVWLVFFSFAFLSFSKPLNEPNRFVSWMKRLDDDLRTKIMSKGTCIACKLLTFLAQTALLVEKVEDGLVQEAKMLCRNLHIEDDRVCLGVISEFKNEVITVVDQVFLNPDEVCGLWLGPTCAHIRDPSGFWNVTIPDKKPLVKPILPPKVCTYNFLFYYQKFVYFSSCFAENLPTWRKANLSYNHVIKVAPLL